MGRLKDNIECHIEMLMDKEELIRIGANKLPHRELQQRVMRIFVAYNKLKEENIEQAEEIEELKDELSIWMA